VKASQWQLSEEELSLIEAAYVDFMARL